MSGLIKMLWYNAMNDAMLMHIIHTHTIKVKEVNANSGEGNSNAKKKCIKNGWKKQEKR